MTCNYFSVEWTTFVVTKRDISFFFWFHRTDLTYILSYFDSKINFIKMKHFRMLQYFFLPLSSITTFNFINYILITMRISIFITQLLLIIKK